MGKIRLYISQALAVNQKVVLEAQQSHYLLNVMKLKKGEILNCFDNQSGEYSCELLEISKKQAVLEVKNREKEYMQCPDIWLLFAPVKKDNTDFIIQKATELGVRKIIPVLTKYTITERVKKERFSAQSIEAAEQCRRTDLPEIADIVKLEELLNNWDKKRTLYYMDESLSGQSVKEIFPKAPVPCAILVGPEGGFSEKEFAILKKLPFSMAVSLGNRILRAETAVVAALSCWQAMSGDWQ